jgi:serine/threonine protein kinase
MDRDAFIRHLRRSGLLPGPALDEAARLPVDESAGGIARALVDRGLLTRFQARRILAGKAGRLLLGQYKLLEQLGRGATGRVYKAVHTTMDRVVAIKVILASILKDRPAVELFNREVRAAARLHHPNVVTAYDADEVKGVRFLVMEYVNGPSLQQLVKDRGPLPIELACDLMGQAVAALCFANDQGVVHRDIKPANLLIADPDGPRPQVKVVDFGLARVRTVGLPHAIDTIPVDPGMVFGTVDYISPEQAQDVHDVDVRSDMYSLGCTFYYALTGRVPFPGGNPMEKLLKQLLNEPRPLRELRPDIPAGLEAVIRRMTAKAKGDRFQGPAELARELAALSGSRTVESAPPAVPDRTATRSAAPTGHEFAGETEQTTGFHFSAALPPPPAEEFRERFRQWTMLVELTLRRRSSLRKVNRKAYAGLYRDLLAACRAHAAGADVEKHTFFKRLEELLKPWLTPEALAHADLEIHYQLAHEFQQIERELDKWVPYPEASAESTTFGWFFSQFKPRRPHLTTEAQIRKLFGV